ncbi:MAG: hypothetical protein EBZ13_10880, partial [Planctomycetia bacterium]|nr:hypothetical protein [Planctomycetia bacterium]
PVSLSDGPDGGLYVVDMHRAVIEHPDWMPVELRSRADLRWGNQAGRIYRIVPADSARSSAQRLNDLSAATDQELVIGLGSGNRWRRMTAGRLLLDRFGQRDAGGQRWLALALRELGPTHQIFVAKSSGCSVRLVTRSTSRLHF